jgi:hypothetical protein
LGERERLAGSRPDAALLKLSDDVSQRQTACTRCARGRENNLLGGIFDEHAVGADCETEPRSAAGVPPAN